VRCAHFLSAENSSNAAFYEIGGARLIASCVFHIANYLSNLPETIVNIYNRSMTPAVKQYKLYLAANWYYFTCMQRRVTTQELLS
jgi:hypothetical protein